MPCEAMGCAGVTTTWRAACTTQCFVCLVLLFSHLRTPLTRTYTPHAHRLPQTSKRSTRQRTRSWCGGSKGAGGRAGWLACQLPSRHPSPNKLAKHTTTFTTARAPPRPPPAGRGVRRAGADRRRPGHAQAHGGGGGRVLNKYLPASPHCLNLTPHQQLALCHTQHRCNSKTSAATSTRKTPSR
jgi:hypothetical protein